MITQTNQREMDLSFSIPLIQTIIFSSCIAFLPNVVNLLFVMASLPYFYRKKLPYFITFIAFQFLHLFIDQTGTYLLIIYFVGYISFSAFVRLCRGNLKISMNLFQLVSCILFSIHPTQQITILVVMVIVQVILMGEEDETMALVTLFLGASGILLYYLMPTNQEIYLILSCFVICLMSNVKLSCMIFFLYFLFFGLSPILFIGLILLSQLKQHRLVMISVFICFMLLVEMSWVEYVISGCCCLVMLLIPHINRDEMIQVPRQLNDEKEPIQQQLQYFSSIFENLGLYYEQLSEIQATFLKSMSKALNYTSRKCEYHRDQTFQLRREIYNCIEDHGYEIEKIECKENEEGTHRVVCQVRGIKKKEIKKIIKAINKTNYEFELIKIHHQKWNQDTITIELQTIAQIGVEALSTSCFIREESGDTTVIFKHEQSVYCMLSDGMGSGEEAKRVSMCIGELFQKMVLSGIHLLEAMTCMNQLLQGDAYATCDVCAFDTISKSVIVCKSAASPTYLIRNRELYAIWGNSLPIGIIAHIDIDHIHVQVEKGDWFIMSSDGVGLDEIKEWMRGLTGLSVSEETLRFNQILKKKKREDDSTVLIAKIV